MEAKKILSKNEVAEYFGVTIRTITNWTTQGTLKPFKVGGLVYYRLTDIEALFNPLNASTDE